jgi:hypothetical protein
MILVHCCRLRIDMMHVKIRFIPQQEMVVQIQRYACVDISSYLANIDTVYGS